NQKSTSVPSGCTLRIEVLLPALILWTSDNWSTRHEDQTHPTAVGVHLLDISTANLAADTVIAFTFRWSSGNWEQTNFAVTVVPLSDVVST
ncbi:MAG TPA: hypothetical protein VKB49_27345, partial [Candidatus Sulfotelmatobacter sp.]|nr:hypothetical protein [Candidatus Sulfotelmatobacter sp.]